MPQHRASRSLLAAAALALTVVLGGCGDDAEQPQAAASSAPAGDASSSPSRDRQPSASPATGPTLALRIDDGDVTPTAETISMSTGEVLVVQVDADRPGELHVHASPEQYVEFGQGRSRHRITLDKPGQVDVEEHESGVLVARLLVS